MLLTVSVAVCNPDISRWKRFVYSLNRFLPEDSEVRAYDNSGSNLTQEWQEFLWETIPLDNNSPRAIVVRGEKNIGFGAAHNYNLTQAQGDYFLVLNDDVEFFEPFVEKMIELLPKKLEYVIRKNTNIMQVGMSQENCNVITPMAQGAKDESLRKKGVFDYIEGSCMMMRTEDAKRYGLFDTEAFPFAYYEDVDLSLRIRKDGGKLAVVDTKWSHHRAATSKKMKEDEDNKIDLDGFHTKNWLTFRKRWGGYLVSRRPDCTRHIVVRRCGGHGDVFLTTPVLKSLKEKYPGCAITFLTQSPDIVRASDSSVFDAISTDCYVPIPCDEFIDLENSYERNFNRHIVDWYAEVAGVQVENRLGIPSISRDDVTKMNVVLMANGLTEKNYVVLGVGDAWEGKRWADERWAYVSLRLKQAEMKVVLCGSSKDGFILPGVDVNFINVLTLPQTMWVIANSAMFAGHEGALGHLAQSVQVPTVLLYGCTIPGLTNTINDQLFPVVTRAECRGCRHKTGTFSGNGILCPRGHACMDMIEMKEVWSTCSMALDTAKKREGIKCL